MVIWTPLLPSLVEEVKMMPFSEKVILNTYLSMYIDCELAPWFIKLITSLYVFLNAKEYLIATEH